jgi:hypothetical protein
MKMIPLLILCVVLSLTVCAQRVLKAHYVITGYKYNSDATFSFQYRDGKSTIDIYNDVDGSQWIIFNDVPGYRVLKGYSTTIAPMETIKTTPSTSTSYLIRKRWTYLIDKNNTTSDLNTANIDIFMRVDSDTPSISFTMYEGANISEYLGYAVKLY